MLIKNLIQTADKSDYGARADRSIQSGRVILIDKTARELILDVGMIDANGAGVYMHGVPYTPQTPPQFNDIVPLLRTNSSPYSVVSGSGAQVGGGNTNQVVESAGVNSIKKTGETTGQQGDLILDPGANVTISRSGKTFTIGETNTATIGGLLDTGVTITSNGDLYTYMYNSGVAADVNFTLPQLIASGDKQLTYMFVNNSAFNIIVAAFSGDMIEAVSTLTMGPGQYWELRGLKGSGSDGIWRVTTLNPSLEYLRIRTGTTYTLAAGDTGSVQAFNNSSAITVTVPTFASVAIPIGARIVVRQLGTGLVTLSPAGGVTLHNSGGLSAIQQYASMILSKIAADEWIITNDAYGISQKRACVISLCEAFTPAGTGADIAEKRVPFNPTDGSSITWNVKSIFLRVNTAGGAPVVVIQKSTVGNAVFGSGSTVGTITFSSGDYEGEVTSMLGTVASGDKLRFSVTTLATATGWNIDVILEQQ